MKHIQINFTDLIYTVFGEFNFTVSTQTAHPLYTLRMNLPGGNLSDLSDKTRDSDSYCRQLFERTLELSTFDYLPFIHTNLEHIVDCREWLNSYLLLVVTNKELFLAYGDVERYSFLVALITRKLSVFNTDMLLPIHPMCEECRHRIVTRIYRYMKQMGSLSRIEREYALNQLQYELKQFDNIRNLTFGPALFDELKQEFVEQDLKTKLLNDLKTEHENGGNASAFEMKKIHVTISAVEFGKLIGDLFKNIRGDNDMYVFDYDNTALAHWIVNTFIFPKGKQVNAKTMMGYLPSPRTHHAK